MLMVVFVDSNSRLAPTQSPCSVTRIDLAKFPSTWVRLRHDMKDVEGTVSDPAHLHQNQKFDGLCELARRHLVVSDAPTGTQRKCSPRLVPDALGLVPGSLKPFALLLSWLQ